MIYTKNNIINKLKEIIELLNREEISPETMTELIPFIDRLNDFIVFLKE